MAVLTTFRLADSFGQHLIEIANYASYDYVLNCAPGGIGVGGGHLLRHFPAAGRSQAAQSEEGQGLKPGGSGRSRARRLLGRFKLKCSRNRRAGRGLSPIRRA